MLKGIFIKMCLRIMILSFCLHFSLPGHAEQSCDEAIITSTEAGNRKIPPGWRSDCDCDDGTPVIFLSSDKVERNNSIEVWVDSEGEACPAYTWTISGSGFHFNEISGPKTATTGADLERIELWADNSACGSAIITVTDACSKNMTASVREPIHGHWVLVEEITCGTVDAIPGQGNCRSDYYCTKGAYKYLDSWVAGTNMGTRWHPTGNCEKYPCTPYTRNYCYDPGYYPKFYHVGIQYKKKWKWNCP